MKTRERPGSLWLSTGMPETFVCYTFVESITNAVEADSWKSDTLLDTEQSLTASLSLVASESGEVVACVCAERIRKAVDIDN